MWGTTSPTLKLDLTGETGQLRASEGQASTGGSTSAGLLNAVAPRFRWSPDAVRRLVEEAEWALTSNPTGPAEIAGLLLGKSGPIIEIIDCHPVLLMLERDHANALTGPGKLEFERTMAAFRSNTEGELSVIGFYRSQMGDRLDLTEEDLGLVRTCFRDTNQVVLLMTLTESRSNTVRLFLGDRGQVLRDFRSSEDESELPRWLELWLNLSADGPPHTASPEEKTESAYPTEPPKTAPQNTLIRPAREVQENRVAVERRANRTPLFLLAAGTFLLAAAAMLAILVGYTMFKGLIGFKQGTDTSRPAAVQAQHDNSDSSQLALRVERHSEDLRLDWNRDAPAVAAATRGILTIREEKGQERQVMLDGNLLRTGAVMYRPVHGNVFLRLVIFGQNGAKIGESVATYPSANVRNQK